MWSVWLVFCDCGFHSVCPLRDKDKRLMEASWGERLWGKLGLVLMGRAMLSKSFFFLRHILISRVQYKRPKYYEGTHSPINTNNNVLSTRACWMGWGFNKFHNWKKNNAVSLITANIIIQSSCEMNVCNVSNSLKPEVWHHTFMFVQSSVSLSSSALATIQRTTHWVKPHRFKVQSSNIEPQMEWLNRWTTYTDIYYLIHSWLLSWFLANKSFKGKIHLIGVWPRSSTTITKSTTVLLAKLISSVSKSLCSRLRAMHILTLHLLEFYMFRSWF